ncbi:MAG: folylpolyglutamate synthase/dihydrofolate synthase family protein [Flavobacteriaceae bacterium]
MTYQETLHWMYAQLPMYQQKGVAAYHAKLDTIRALAQHLGNPHQHFKSIHVAGTNGKGSSSHMLASILQEAGYSVGLYTSPHLKDYRERIKLNGIPVGKQYVMGFVQRNRPFLERHKMSFFEMSVGMAFAYFAHKKVDIAVVEVGLGGRLDSTNIIVPEVSLITNIGMDHLDILGDTVQKIAYEKAGIIKEGVPVVISEYQEEVADVFKEVAHQKKSQCLFAKDVVTGTYTTDLLGQYQKRNVKGVVAALGQLKGFDIGEAHIKKGLQRVVPNTGLLGRWQQLGERPMVICDTAHNQEGLTITMAQVAQQEFENLHMVIGFVKDKNLDLVLPLFPKGARYYFARPNVPRGLGAKSVLAAATAMGLQGRAYPSVASAYLAARRHAKPTDMIYVGGSTFVVSEVV